LSGNPRTEGALQNRKQEQSTADFEDIPHSIPPNQAHHDTQDKKTQFDAAQNLNPIVFTYVRVK